MLINYQVMEKKHIDDVAACITHAFTQHEPLTSFLRIPEAVFHRHMLDVCHHIAANNLSIVALQNSKLVGARLATKYGDTLTPYLPEMQIVQAVLGSLHTGVELSTHYHCLHLLMMGVDHAYNNQGIAQMLLKHTLRNARDKGFEFAVVEATTPVTQHIFANKFAFQTLKRIEYHNFRHRGHTVLENMPGISPYCALMGGPL